jgi:hypothetical protein
LKKTTLLLTVCLALLVAGNAFCASYYFWVERTDDGTTGVWTYTLYNDSTQEDGIGFDLFGLFGSSESNLMPAGPDPSGWDYREPGYHDYMEDYWQITWESNWLNVPFMGESVAGFSIVAPEGATAPTKFDLVYFDYDLYDYVYFTGDIYDPNALPEPSSAMALMAALPMMGAAAYRRKRKTSNN